MHHNVEVEITPIETGLLIQKKSAGKHPVERLYGILGESRSTDDYLEEIRGR